MPIPPAVSDFKAQFTREFVYGTNASEVMDTDITRAITEARAVFNPGLWSSDAECMMAYCYVTAHFMVLNIQAAGGLSDQILGVGVENKGEAGVAVSKSVGDVSVNYSFPERITGHPVLSQFMTTDYGKRYLQILLPRIVGGVFVAQGPNTPDTNG